MATGRVIKNGFVNVSEAALSDLPGREEEVSGGLYLAPEYLRRVWQRPKKTASLSLLSSLSRFLGGEEKASFSTSLLASLSAGRCLTFSSKAIHFTASSLPRATMRSTESV